MVEVSSLMYRTGRQLCATHSLMILVKDSGHKVMSIHKAPTVFVTNQVEEEQIMKCASTYHCRLKNTHCTHDLLINVSKCEQLLSHSSLKFTH